MTLPERLLMVAQGLGREGRDGIAALLREASAAFGGGVRRYKSHAVSGT